VEKEMKKKITLLSLVILICVGYFIYNRIPGKNAIYISKIPKNENIILIQEGYHTGTGWVMVGDSEEFFDQSEYYDIYLEGAIPPEVGIPSGEELNTYVCWVEYQGEKYSEVFDAKLKEYEISDWSPLYPIKRNTILPSWFYPKSYMTKKEVVDNSFIGE